METQINLEDPLSFEEVECDCTYRDHEYFHEYKHATTLNATCKKFIEFSPIVRLLPFWLYDYACL